MARLSYEAWEDRFDVDAERDGYNTIQHFCDFIPRCDVDADAVLSGTKALVALLAQVDYFGTEMVVPEAQKFLRMQKYDPAEAKGAKYIIGLETDAFGWARLVWDDVGFTDLADFHSEYTLRSLVIFRVDGRRMSVQEHRRMTNAIEADLHCDFGSETKILYYWQPKRLTAVVHEEDEELSLLVFGMTAGFSLPEVGMIEGTVESAGSKRVRVSCPGERKLTVVSPQDIWYAVLKAFP